LTIYDARSSLWGRHVNAAVGRCLALSLLAAGCGAEFDSASQIDGLRVLAVKKSLPYARPGQTVDLELLWHDSQGERAAPQIAWLAICENPPGDLFEACFTQVPNLTADELAARSSFPEGSEPNDRFSFVTSPDIISSRPLPPNPATTPYGLHYVFFAACAGELAFVPTAGFPFVCYREQDDQPGFTAGDNQLDSRDFVLGYTAVFVYEELANTNPSMHGFEFNGATLTSAGSEGLAPGAVVLEPRDLCFGDACEPVAPEADAEACPDVLTLDACVGDCGEVVVAPLIDSSNAEIDEAASSGTSGVLGEQMWVNYYSTGGELSEEVRLLNDATSGWNDNFESEYKPAETATVSYLWAVAHDNRGGAEWARLRICTLEPGQ
jgi:hypothetical protein